MMQEMVYRALFPRDLIAGLPRTVFIFNIASVVIIAIGLQQYWFFVVFFVVFIAGGILTQHDEHLIETAFFMLMEPSELEV